MTTFFWIIFHCHVTFRDDPRNSRGECLEFSISRHLTHVVSPSVPALIRGLRQFGDPCHCSETIGLEMTSSAFSGRFLNLSLSFPGQPESLKIRKLRGAYLCRLLTGCGQRGEFHDKKRWYHLRCPKREVCFLHPTCYLP